VTAGFDALERLHERAEAQAGVNDAVREETDELQVLAVDACRHAVHGVVPRVVVEVEDETR
jgi:hypothetical protein